MAKGKEPSAEEVAAAAKAAEDKLKAKLENKKAEVEAKVVEAEAKVAAAEAKAKAPEPEKPAPRGPFTGLKIKNNMLARAELLKKQAEDMAARAEAAAGYGEAGNGSGTPQVGIWKSPTALEKLGLSIKKICEEGIELHMDVVPGKPGRDGVSTNGVQFPSGSVQLLPVEMWKDIRGRISKRNEEEKKFMFPIDQINEMLAVYHGIPRPASMS